MKTTKRKRFTLRWSKEHCMWRLLPPCGKPSNIDLVATKAAAVTYARAAARARQPSQLVIYKRNGRIQTEYTYGADPRRTKG